MNIEPARAKEYRALYSNTNPIMPYTNTGRSAFTDFSIADIINGAINSTLQYGRAGNTLMDVFLYRLVGHEAETSKLET